MQDLTTVGLIFFYVLYKVSYLNQQYAHMKNEEHFTWLAEICDNNTLLRDIYKYIAKCNVAM